MFRGEADGDRIAAVEWRLAILAQRDLRQAGRRGIDEGVAAEMFDEVDSGRDHARAISDVDMFGADAERDRSAGLEPGSRARQRDFIFANCDAERAVVG